MKMEQKTVTHTTKTKNLGGQLIHQKFFGKTTGKITRLIANLKKENT